MARTLEDIEKAVSRLPRDQLRLFRAWYARMATSNSPTCGRVKLPHPRVARQGDSSGGLRAWQPVRRLPSGASSCLRI